MIAGVMVGESPRVAQIRPVSAPIFLGCYRLLLAFFVFCSHSSWPLAQVVTQADVGGIGVTSFFIVSGFLITLTIEAHYTDSMRGFFINRFLRIYPTFWVSMVVAVLAVLATGTTYVAANFYLRGWTWDNILRCILIFPATGGNDTWGPIPVGWTLQIELSFYLVIAALYLMIGRLPQRVRHLVVVCFCAGCLIAYAVTMATVTLGPFNAVRFVPFFVAGTATAIISRLERNQNPMRLFGGAVLIIALVLCGYFMFSLPLPTRLVTGTMVTAPIIYGLFFFLLLPTVVSRLVRFKRIDSFLGDLTYPVYTLHFPLNTLMAMWLYAYLGPSTVFVQIAITTAAAYLVLRLVDRPMSRMRARVREQGAEAVDVIAIPLASFK